MRKTPTFAHRQLATLARLRAWGISVTSVECNTCHSATEVVEHLVVHCEGEACKSALKARYVSVLRWGHATASDIGSFLTRRLTLAVSGELLYEGEADVASGFGTGFLPTDFVAILWEEACVWAIDAHN